MDAKGCFYFLFCFFFNLRSFLRYEYSLIDGHIRSMKKMLALCFAQCLGNLTSAIADQKHLLTSQLKEYYKGKISLFYGIQNELFITNYWDLKNVTAQLDSEQLAYLKYYLNLQIIFSGFFPLCLDNRRRVLTYEKIFWHLNLKKITKRKVLCSIGFKLKVYN